MLLIAIKTTIPTCKNKDKKTNNLDLSLAKDATSCFHLPGKQLTIDCLEERGVEGEGKKKRTKEKETVHNLPWKIEAARVSVNQTYLTAVPNASQTVRTRLRHGAAPASFRQYTNPIFLRTWPGHIRS